MEITPEILQIVGYVTTLCPSLAAIIGILISIVAMVRKLAAACEEFKNSAELKEVCAKLKKAEEEKMALLADNREIKKQLCELLTELTKVQHDDKEV